LIYQVLGIGFFISMISGDPGSMIDSVVQQASALQTLAYSRDFEREADQSSVALMQKLGRDPKAMLALLDRVVPKDFDHTTSFLSTHPGLDERRIEIEQSIK
jgi:predicted Zn-dependent protease